MILPKLDTMTPETLEAIIGFVEEGATIIGNPPIKSPSLVNYPDSDAKVVELATELWGSLDLPVSLTARKVGKGTVYWGQDIYLKKDDKGVLSFIC